MIKAHGVVRAAARQVAQAVSHTVQDLDSGLVEQEPAFTDRMLGRIAEAMDGFETNGIKWRAKTLTDRGSNAQEARYGADFVGVLHVSLSDYVIKKGFLAQAKMATPGTQMRSQDWQRLADQCAKMLALSPDSYVFIYSARGVDVVPAVAIAAAHGSASGQLYAFYRRSVRRFFEEHFESFIGDPRISAPSIDTLQQLSPEYRARKLLYLEASRA